MKKGSVSVVMPSYNERENIAEAIRRVSGALKEALLEIVIVDDNSPDGTWQLVQDLHNPKCILMIRKDKRGLASALADGTKSCRGDIIVWLDCDLGIPPEVIPRLVHQMDAYDVAIGSRYVPGGADNRPMFRAFLSTAFNLYARMVLGPEVRDYTSGFTAARRHVLEAVPLSEKGFGDYFIEWAHQCVKKKFRIIEVAYPYGLRKGGVSKTDGDWKTFLRLGAQYSARVLEAGFSK